MENSVLSEGGCDSERSLHCSSLCLRRLMTTKETQIGGRSLWWTVFCVRGTRSMGGLWGDLPLRKEQNRLPDHNARFLPSCSTGVYVVAELDLESGKDGGKLYLRSGCICHCPSLIQLVNCWWVLSKLNCLLVIPPCLLYWTLSLLQYFFSFPPQCRGLGVSGAQRNLF